MKRIKTLFLALLLTLSALCLASCGLSNCGGGKEETTEIVFVDDYDIPAVRIGVEYNFEPYFTKEKGTTYTMTAKYLDDALNEIDLDVNGFTFVQNEFSDVFVTITATKGDTVYTGEVTIPMDTTYDPTDYWVVDSLYADPAMTKSLNYLPTYRTSMDSLTSVKFSYRGNAKKDSPVSAISLMDWPNNSRLTVSDWSNAVITLDVYNTSEKDIALGFIMNHSSGISYSFDQCEKFICKPNEWTHIDYSLKALNLTEDFIFNPDWDLSDRIIIQTIYDGAKEDGSIYSYSFYVDNVDICDYSEEKFPDLDTTTYKEYEDFFTKDPNLSGVVNNDYENKKEASDLQNTTELVEYSNRSIKFVLSEDGSEASGFLHSFIGGHPTGWLPMDITDATLSFYIRTVNADNTFALKFESDYNVFADPIVIDLTKDSGEGWTVTEENGWYKVVIDVAQTNVETALVRMDFIRTMRLYFSNTAAQAGSESAIYLDTLKLEGWKVTEVYGDEEIEWDTKSPYTAAEDHDMFSTDENLVFNVNYERVDTLSTADINERMDNSSYSYKLTLSANGDKATATVDSFFTGKPMDWTIMDITNATVSFGVKNVNVDNVFYVSFASDYNENGLILGAKVAIDLSQASGEGWTVTQLENGWCLVTLDIKNADITDEVLGVTKDFIKIMHIEFSNTKATAGSESAVYLDNLNVVGAVPTSAALDEENPWETKSPYVNYVITFENSDGTVISQKTYHYGETVVVPEAPSMSDLDKEGTFTFEGWSSEIETVTKNATYKAIVSGSFADLINTGVNQETMDSVGYDSAIKSENSNRSLKVTAAWTEVENVFPYFSITLNQYYDLSNQYVVFDLYKNNYDSWFAVDFVNNDAKIGVWKSVSFNAGSNEATHKCEDLGEGWIRVYVNVPAMMDNNDVSNVNKIYLTIHSTKAEASGNIEFYLDNLHFEELPTFTVTFKDYDGSVISSESYKAGSAVNVPANPTREAIAGECSYVFAGWDYEVTAVTCDATYTAVYTVTDIIDLINTTVDKDTIDSVAYDVNVVSGNSTHSLKVTGEWNKADNQFPYFNVTLDKYYDLSDKYVVFDIYKNNYASWFCLDFVNNDAKIGLWNTLAFNADSNEATHKCEDLGEGWLRVYVNVAALANGVDVTNVNKFYVTVNNGNEGAEGNLEFYLDNLHFEALPTFTVTFKDYDGRVISSESYKAGSAVNVPANPTREAIAGECSYVFAGWDYEVTAVTCDATYTATYTLTNVLDLWNGNVENGGIDSLTNDTEVKSENSSYSLNIVESIAGSNLPYFAITLDKNYDLTGKYIVFDFKPIERSGWLVVFDFVNDDVKLGLWNMLSLNSGINEATHKCEDLGNGWLKVYVDADVLSGSLNNVSKIYITLNASDGSGALNLHFDNLHFEEKPEIPTYTITFKDYDGRVISSAEYDEGATVVVPENPTRDGAGECTYTFAGWDYEVTAVNCDATYMATYTLTNVLDLWNCNVENGGIDSLTNDTEVKSENSSYSLNIVEAISSGNLPYFALTLDKTYDLTGKYMVFDTNISKDGWLVVFDFVNNDAKLGLWNMLTLKSGTAESTHKCEDLGNGWIRVYVDADVLNGSLNSVSKIYVTLNASDGSGTLTVNFDNLHFENKPTTPTPEEPETPNPEEPEVPDVTLTEADDSIGACGLAAVNGGSASIVTDTVSSNSEKSAKFNVPAGNSGVWWNYDVDVTSVLGGGLNLVGKTITFDVKIVGNMTWVGFTVADGNGTYATPNGESYAWMNLSNGWSGFGMSITAIENGWFRVSLTPDTSFSGASGNLTKLRFLVNPQDANEASMYVDNLYLGDAEKYQEPTRSEADDAIGACGLVAVNGGTMTVDTSVVSVNSEKSVKCTVPAGNSGVWWNYDISLVEVNGGAVNLSGKTITFDLKIVGSMSLVGFTVEGNGAYAQPDGEGYVWTNLTDGWGADKGWVVTAMDNGWFRVSFTADTKFSGCSGNITKLRFLVNPSTADEASMYIDNLYLA